LRKRLRERIAWAHPEWWSIALSVAAWASLAASAGVVAFAGHHVTTHATASFVAYAGDWLLMVVAMMFPLSVGAIQATAARSLWRRRHRAIAWWLVGYLAPWSGLGFSLWLITATLFTGDQSAPGVLIALAFAAAAIWHTTPTRARAVSGCHRTQPLAPTGWRANYDCVRYGWATGTNCVVACGALMAACSLLGHGLGGLMAMVSVTAISLAERYMVRPDRRLLAAAVGVHALVIAAIVPS
jgi:hypothetical protein